MSDEESKASAPEELTASLGVIFGRNLAIARAVAELTQDELAGAAKLARATIISIENGNADPKLSSIEQIAKALNVPATLLLLEPSVLMALRDMNFHGKDRVATSPEMERIRDLLSTKSAKDRNRAAKIGAGVLGGAAVAAKVGAALGTVLLPGVGTAVGAAVGCMLAGSILKFIENNSKKIH